MVVVVDKEQAGAVQFCIFTRLIIVPLLNAKLLT